MPFTFPTIRLFDFPLVNAKRQSVCRNLLDGTTRRLAFINADCVNKAASDKEYRRALEQMDALLPDGSGLALAAAMRGRRFAGNLNGTDLFPILCAEARRLGKSVFLLGGKPGVAEQAATNAVASFPGLRIAGSAHGYFEPNDEAKIVESINNTGADILLVALGAPLQEKFITRHSTTLLPTLVMGVGGLLDFVAGRIPRAPKLIRSVGMEWVWRLACEPRRMARRYLLGNPAFVARAAGDAVTHIPFYRITKRLSDVILSASALVALAPVFAVISGAIRWESKGGAFFVQTRAGNQGRPFRMVKFRTMHANAEQRLSEIRARSERQGVAFKMADDPRITRVGKWLRRTSLDELPQLINVLKGEMSLVGPRPALPREIEQYQLDAKARLEGAPGITCLWQIAGRADLGFEKQVELDVAYLNARSTMLDILIIALTPIAMITRRGAY